MQRKQNRRRNLTQASFEAIEPRILFAYAQMTPITGAANPLNGIDVGGLSTPALGDVDGDGDLDAVGGAQAGTLLYFRNLGTATSPGYAQQTGAANPLNGLDVGSLSTPALGDIDSDGDLDAVVGEQTGTLLYYRNIGTAIGPIFVQQTGAGNPFNGLDVGNFSAPALADLDGDGDLDALLGADDGAVRYYRNTGNAISPVYVQQTGAANPFNAFAGDDSTPALGDVDGDGDLDALVGAADGTLAYLKNTGTATNAAYAQQTGAANPLNGFDVGLYSTPTLADMDGDGDLDAVVGADDGTLRYARTNVLLTAINPSQQSGAANPFNGINTGDDSQPRPALGDVDGDGDLDVVFGGGTGLPQPLRYFRNTGTASAGAFTELTGAANPFNEIANFSEQPAFGDVDGDGDLDLVLGYMGGDFIGHLAYYKNTGTATNPVFTPQAGTANPFDSFATGSAATPALADLDGDGDLDLIAGAEDGTLHYLKNTGSATNPVYAEQTGAANPFNGLISAIGYLGPAPGDIDGDGDVDLVVGHGTGILFFLKNTGTATAPVYVLQSGAASPFNGIDVGTVSRPALGDMDGDGDLDAIIGNFEGIPFYFRTNRAPVLDNAIPDQTFTGPGVHTYTAPADTFADLENNPLTYSAALTNGAALPAWLSFNPSTRQFSGNPFRLDASPLQIRLTANDGRGGNGFEEFQLTLVNVGDPPVANNDSYSVNQDFVLTANGVAPNPAGVLANDNDPEGFPLSASVVSQPSHGSVSMTLDGKFTYTPTPGYSGPDSFTYQNGNGVLTSNIGTVSINVIDTARPTVLASQFLFETGPQKVTVKFSENVAPSLSANDFMVTPVAGHGVIGFTFGYDAATNTASLSFDPVLFDSDYRLTVLAPGITDAAGNTLAANHDLEFFFMAGDANRDRSVDIGDFSVLAFRFNRPGTFSQGDFNYSGSTEIGDFAILASKFNTSLPQPGDAPRTAIFLDPSPSSALLGATARSLEPKRLFTEMKI